MSASDTVSLALYVCETHEMLSERNERERSTPHPFQQIVGMETEREHIGQFADEVREFQVPEQWAVRLMGFARAWVYEPPRGNPLPPPMSNCHGLATWMTTGIKDESSLPAPVAYEKVELDPAFGAHIMLGYEKTAGRAHARHSALGLGDLSPGECLQMTHLDGVLAIDSLTAMKTFYENDGQAPHPHFWFYPPARPGNNSQKTIRFVSR